MRQEQELSFESVFQFAPALLFTLSQLPRRRGLTRASLMTNLVNFADA